MSPRQHAQRCAATAAALVATLAVGGMAGQATFAADPQQAIDASGVQATSPVSTEIVSLQGQGAQGLAAREHTSPWRIKLRPNTAWLISPYLIERHNHGRWSTLNA